MWCPRISKCVLLILFPYFAATEIIIQCEGTLETKESKIFKYNIKDIFDFKVFQNKYHCPCPLYTDIRIHCNYTTACPGRHKAPAPLRCGYATLYSRKLPNLFPLEKDIKSKLWTTMQITLEHKITKSITADE